MQPRQAGAPAPAAAQAQGSRSAGSGDAELPVLDQPQPGVVELLVLWGETRESCVSTQRPSAGLESSFASPSSCPHPADEESCQPRPDLGSGQKLRTTPAWAPGVAPATASQAPNALLGASILPPCPAAPSAGGQMDNPPALACAISSREQLAGSCLRDTACTGWGRLAPVAASHRDSSSTQTPGLCLRVSPHFLMQVHGFFKMPYSSSTGWF